MSGQFFSIQFMNPLKKIHVILFSLFNLLLSFAYPTFLFLLIPFYLIAAYALNAHAREIFWSQVLIFGIAALSVAWIIFYHFHVSLQDVQQFFNFLHGLNATSNQGIFSKFLELMQRLFIQYSYFCFIATALMVIAFFGRQSKLILLSCCFLILVLPFFKINIRSATYVDAFFVLNYMGFLSTPLFLIFLREEKQARTLFLFIGIPALAAGIVTGVTATLRELNVIIGFFPASLLAYIFLFFIIQKYLNGTSSLRYWATRAVLFFGLIELAFFQWNFIYGSNFIGLSLYKNTVKITLNNPFGGLHVDSKCATLVTELQKDLDVLDNPQAREFVYFGLFSAGYLFPTQLKPGEYILYASPTQNHFGKQIRTPNYVFDFSKLWQFPPERIQEYLNGAQYHKIAVRTFYDIYASDQTNISSM